MKSTTKSSSILKIALSTFIFLFVIITANETPYARAYNAVGHWQDEDLPVVVNLNFITQNLGSFSPDIVRGEIRKAMNTWNSVGTPFWFVEGEGANIREQVQIAYGTSSEYPPLGDAGGATCFRHDDAGTCGGPSPIPIRGAVILFNSRHEFKTDCGPQLCVQFLPLPKYDIQSIVLHEFGHALGLDHVTNSNAIMWFSSDYNCTNPVLGTSTCRRDLFADDIDGLRSIYGLTTPAARATTPGLVASPIDGALIPATQVQLSWSDSSNAQGYYVQVSSSRDFLNIVYRNNPTQSSDIVSGLSIGATYYWRVKGRGTGGNSTWGPIRSFTITNPITCYFLNTNPSPSNSGWLEVNPSPNCGGNGYNPGTTVQVIAHPNTNYSFSSWSGSVSSSNNPLSITMNGNKNLTANFTYTSGTLSVTSAWITDQNNNTKTTFNAGDVIVYHYGYSNSTGSTQNPFVGQAAWGPCGYIMQYDDYPFLPTGTGTINLQRTVPSNACSGSYTYGVSINYHASITSRETNFTVNGVDSQTVKLTSIWITDGNNNSKTIFNPGDSIIYYMSYANTTGSTQSPFVGRAAWGPCGYVMQFDDYPTMPPGTGTLALTRSIPNDACSGSYTYGAAVNYNASITSQETNFSVSNVVPSAPSNLQIVNTTQSAITLQWNDNSNNEDGFRIYRWTGSQWISVGVVGANTTSYSDSRPCGTGETYQAAAYNSGGESWSPNYVGGATKPCSPTAPTNLRIVSTTQSAINLQWNDNSNNEDGFRIYRWTGSQWISVGVVGANTTSYSDPRPCGTGETYQVAAYNSGGESWSPNYVGGSTQSCKPAAPTNLRVSNTTQSSVSLAWDDNSGNEDGFHIYYWTGTWTLINQVSTNTTTFTDTGLTCNSMRTYMVAAYNASGDGDWSNFVDGTTLACGNWHAEYFATYDWTGSVVYSEDFAGPALNRDWGNGSPNTNVPSDRFSARFTNTLSFASGNYVFNIDHDDGVVVWLDGHVLFDASDNGNHHYTCPAVSIAAGNHSLIVYYRENTGAARIYLDWQTDPSVCNGQIPPAPPILTGPTNGQIFATTDAVQLGWTKTNGMLDVLIEVWGGPFGTTHQRPCGSWTWIDSCTPAIGTFPAGYTYTWQVTGRNWATLTSSSATRTFTIRSASNPAYLPFIRR